MKAKLPAMGQMVATKEGRGKVIGGNPIKETVSVRLESDAVLELPLESLPGHGKSEASDSPKPKPKSRPKPKRKRNQKKNLAGKDEA